MENTTSYDTTTNIENDYDDDDEMIGVTTSTTAGGASNAEQQQQQVTATSYGALDISRVITQQQRNNSNSNDCWLIRIPPKLAEVLELIQQQEESNEGMELGELIFTKGGTKNDGTVVKPALTIHISEELIDKYSTSNNNNNITNKKLSNSISTLPLHYSIQAMTKKIPVMYPFIRHPTSGSCTLLGTVTRTGNVQVYQQDSNYRNLLKQRIISSNINGQRFVKPVDVTESILSKQQRPMVPSTIPGGGNKHSFGNAVYQYGKQLQEATQESSLLSNIGGSNNSSGNNNNNGPSAKKKARQFAPDQSIRSVLFELFEQQPYWTIKELRAAAIYGGCNAASAKRGEAEIRDVLRTEIGEYHRSGDYKNKWELRKEFQQQQKK